MAATGFTPLSLYYSTTGAAVPVNTNLTNGELAINIADGKLYYKDSLGAVKLLASNAGSLGDVVGPASATDTAIATFDGTTGKLIKNNSAVTIGTTGNTVISVTDSTNAALRVTQLSTATNAIAFLVEDVANPDPTPFVIDANGRVVTGNTSAVSFTGGLLPQMEVLGNTNNTSAFGIGSFRADAGSGYATFLKSRSATVGTLGGVVVSGDSLGTILWNGDDGTAGIQAASISASVDGTPGINDMPGRLVFSTTNDGGLAPTERMRIDSGGRVGIGATPSASISLQNSKTITGGTTAYGTVNNGVVQSGVTTDAQYFNAVASTAAASFVAGIVRGYYYRQATIGAGSSITNQYGFFVESDVTGATNNYGFYGNIASGANRWNLYMSGTAANFFGGDTIVNGKIGLGAAASPSYGTAGQVLTSAGSGASPTWTTPTTGTVTSVGGTGTVNGITLTGTVTSTGNLTLGGTLSGVGLTTQVSGTLPIANGGTNSTATATAGGAAYGTGTAYAFTAAGTTGQVLTSNGASAPTWSTPAASTSISQIYFLSQS